MGNTAKFDRCMNEFGTITDNTSSCYNNTSCSPITKGYFFFTSFIGADTFLLNKVDTNLNVLFSKKYALNFTPANGLGEAAYYFNAPDFNTIETSDSSVYLYGTDGNNIGHVIKFDQNGNYIWAKKINSIFPLTLRLSPAHDGNIYCTYTETSGNVTIIQKTDTGFNNLWSESINIPNSHLTKNIAETTSGNLILFGGGNDTSMQIHESPGCTGGFYTGYFSQSFYLTSLNGSTGTFQWAKKIGIGHNGLSRNLLICNNGELLLGGSYWDTGYDPLGCGSEDIYFNKYLTRLDSNGNTRWANYSFMYLAGQLWWDGGLLNTIAELGNGDIVIGESASGYQPYALFDLINANCTAGYDWHNNLIISNTAITLTTSPDTPLIAIDTSIYLGYAGLNSGLHYTAGGSTTVLGVDAVIYDNGICTDTISGYAWKDVNMNGIWDDGELPLAGVSFPFGYSTTSDYTGYFRTTIIGTQPPANICITPPPGYMASNTNGTNCFSNMNTSFNGPYYFGFQQLGFSTGTVYYDANNDSTMQAGDPGIQNIRVQEDTGLIVFSNNSGKYTFPLLPSTYTIKAIPPADYPTAAVHPSNPVSEIVQSGNSVTQNFGIEFPHNAIDFGVKYIYSDRNINNNNIYVQLEVDKYFVYDTSTVFVTTTYQPGLTYVGSDYQGNPFASLYNVDTISRKITYSISPLMTNSGIIVLGFATSISPDSIFTFTSSLKYNDTTLYDTDTLNNKDSISRTINVSPLDPNNKTAATNTKWEGLHYLPEYTHNPAITYNIVFQNIGTGPAINVALEDTFDHSLDLSTLNITGASNSYRATLNGNVLTVLFAGIDLPDSSANPANSTGWITYTIQPHTGLTPFTQVSNQATIFFDHQAPVPTPVNRIILIDTSCINYSETDTTTCPFIPITLFGDTILGAGIYFDTTYIAGCHNVRTYKVRTVPVVNTYGSVTVCPGSIYINSTGDTIRIPGRYSYHLGCDTLFTFDLLNYPSDINYLETDTICSGNSFSWRGGSYTARGVYYDTIYGGSMIGCDSLVALTLIVNPLPSISISETGSPCTIGADTLTISGSYSYPVSWQQNTALIVIDTPIATVAGGNGDGPALKQLAYAEGVCTDSHGNVFIADTYNQRIQQWAPGATSGTTVVWTGGNGTAANQLSYPTDVLLDSIGNIYVADFDNNRIQKWTQATNSISTVAGSSSGQSGITSSLLSGPSGIFVDTVGNIYIADYRNNRVQKWGPGASSGTTVAGSPAGTAGNAANLLSSPRAVSVDNNGNIYVADMGNNRIQKWAPGANTGITVAGNSAGASGSASNLLNTPTGIFVDGSANIYVSDNGNSRIQKWAAGANTGSTVAGGNGNGGAYDQLAGADGVWLDNNGDIYIADQGNFRIQKYTQSHNYIPTISGSYTATVTNAYGCSATSNAIIIQSSSSTNIFDTICAGSSFAFGSHSYSLSGAYSDTLTGVNGCDSIVTLHLSFYPASFIYLSDTICPGHTLSVGTHIYSQPGYYIDTMSSMHGCDSIVSLSLFVLPLDTFSIYEDVCQGQSVNFGGHSYSISGNYYDTLASMRGCDSIVTLHLAVHSRYTTDLYDTICAGSSISFAGQTLSTTGTFYNLLHSMYGCDSLVVMNLFVDPIFSVAIFDTICSNSAVTFGGHTYSQPGIYHDTLLTVSGCDSIVILNLTVNPTSSINLYDTLITGDTLHLNGHAYTQSGIYYDTLSNVHGCDSVQAIYLYVSTTETFAHLFDTVCQGFSVVVGNHTYTVSGTYVDTLTGTYGGDSVVTLNLTINQALLVNINDTITQGGSVTVGTNTYSQPGTYVDTLTSAAGCDSIVALHLYVVTGISPLSSIQSVSIYPNPNQGSFTIVVDGISSATLTAEVTDMLGRSMYKQNIRTGENKLDLSLTSGIYTVKVSDGNTSTVRMMTIK